MRNPAPATRDLAKLRDEVVAMRQKMLDAHASKSETHFGLKHDRAASSMSSSSSSTWCSATPTNTPN
jgi:hypothetical protein